MNTALVVTEQAGEIGTLRSALQSDCRVDQAPGRDEALAILKRQRYDLIFIDLETLWQPRQETSPETAVKAFLSIYPGLRIVVMSLPDRIRHSVTAVRAGATEYLTFPLDAAEVRHVFESIKASVIREHELEYLRSQHLKQDFPDLIQTRNPAMRMVFQNLRAVAPTKTTVLLVGETGVGKGVLAKLIHRHSNRDRAQFISVHCGAIPETLIESELFGHEKGAFTGATRRKLGKFEIARDGTIFLDEIGTITPAAQIKLLQVLQDGTFSRLGSETVIDTNARVVAATNADLKQMSLSGLFRKDLYYRINVFPITIPPLRERVEDIPLFIQMFLKNMNRLYAKDIHEVHPDVVDALKRYDWPGNIRELENLIERAYILEHSATLLPQSFPLELFQNCTIPSAPVSVNTNLPLSEARRQAIDTFERQYLVDLLSRNCGRINPSAKDAGVSTRQLHKLMVKYGIRKEDYKC